MIRPRLLLVPAFTELEWGIVDELGRWADVATFDTPGTGAEPLPGDLRLESDLRPRPAGVLPRARLGTGVRLTIPHQEIGGLTRVLSGA